MSDKHQQTPYPFRMPQDVRECAQKAADENDRSLNNQLIQLVRLGLGVLSEKENNAQ